MVNALITLNEDMNRILNLIKVRQGLKDKSEAIEFIISKYVDDEAEPELRPEFVQKMIQIQKQKSINVDDFAKRYGLK